MSSLNQWQEYYVQEIYDGKMPRSQVGKYELSLLGQIKNKITVHFPDFKGINGFEPAHTETYKITKDDCNMPEGLISVSVLASNLALWIGRGYKITTA